MENRHFERELQTKMWEAGRFVEHRPSPTSQQKDFRGRIEKLQKNRKVWQSRKTTAMQINYRHIKARKTCNNEESIITCKEKLSLARSTIAYSNISSELIN